MSDNRSDREGELRDTGPSQLSWEEVQSYVAARQAAIDAGEDPDELDREGGPSWEQVQAFVTEQQAKTEKSAAGTEDLAAGTQKKESIFAFGKQEDEFGEDARRELITAMLPGGNLRPLFESDDCLLCSTRPANPKTMYAVTDMGHKEPPGKKSSAIGLRVKTKVGSMVPLQIAACPRCRRNYRIASNLKLAIMIGAMVLGLIVLSLNPVEEALISIHPVLPLVVFLVLLPLSWLLGTLLTQSFIKRKSAQTHFQIDEIPFVNEMVRRGWFQLYDSKPVSRLVFSKERLKSGWFTD